MNGVLDLDGGLLDSAAGVPDLDGVMLDSMAFVLDLDTNMLEIYRGSVYPRQT